MRLNFDGFAGFVKIDAGRFLQKQARFQDFLSALHLQKQGDF